MNITRRIIIKAPIASVREVLSDFHTWPIWSPWFITDPEAQISIDSDGNHFSWNGKIVGEGEMTMTEVTDTTISCDLLYTHPKKTKAKVDIELRPITDSTEVTVEVNGNLPFSLFWMRKRVIATLGSDYERGLSMLKEYVETGKVDSKISYEGIETFPGTEYVGITRETSLDAVDKVIEEDFKSLMTRLNTGNGNWFTMFHKYDLVSKRVKYTACVGIDEKPKSLPVGGEVGALESCDMYVIRHQGPYNYVGNAWNAATMQLRAGTFKADKKKPAIEFYRNSPTNTEPKDLVSDVCFIVK